MKNIDLPEDFRTGKIVQLYIDNKPWLKGDKTESDKRHFQLLEEILRKEGINNFPTLSMGDVKVPALTDGERYRVVGMGACEKFRNVYSFNGWSDDYTTRMSIDINHLQDMHGINPELEFI